MQTSSAPLGFCFYADFANATNISARTVWHTLRRKGASVPLVAKGTMISFSANHA